MLNRHVSSRNEIPPGLYTYHEGENDENSGMLWQQTRGRDDIHFVTPHGWTAAEVFLLLRDCLVREEDGRIVIGSGVPASWMDSDFSVKDLPTYFGKLTFRYVSRDPFDPFITQVVFRALL